MQREIRVGTSGWMYDHWRGRFYPEDLAKTRWFEHYLRVFDTVELNGTFYGTPRPETAQRWHDTTPERFLFAAKGIRYITQRRAPSEGEESLRRQDEALAPLAEKLGPILWQFSPRWDADVEVLDAFLALRPSSQRWCFEFRNPNCFRKEILLALRRHRCALVWADTPYYPFAAEVTGDFLYARLHGHEEFYVSKYRDDQLRWWRDQLLERAEGSRDIFAYFDNDAHGHAPHDAWRLRGLLAGQEEVPQEIPEELVGAV